VPATAVLRLLPAGDHHLAADKRALPDVLALARAISTLLASARALDARDIAAPGAVDTGIDVGELEQRANTLRAHLTAYSLPGGGRGITTITNAGDTSPSFSIFVPPQIAAPFQWRFTRHDLHKLLAKTDTTPQRHHAGPTEQRPDGGGQGAGGRRVGDRDHDRREPPEAPGLRACRLRHSHPEPEGLRACGRSSAAARVDR